MGRLSVVAPRLKFLDPRTLRLTPKRAEADIPTTEHRAWRLEVLKRARWPRQWPGRDAQGGRGSVGLDADHIVERRDAGGPLDPTNGQALCPKQHAVKAARERAKAFSDRLIGKQHRDGAEAQ